MLLDRAPVACQAPAAPADRPHRPLGHSCGCSGGVLIGRVRISRADTDTEARLQTIVRTLEARFAPQAGKRFPDRRLISLRPSDTEGARYEATIYDYALERGFDLTLDGDGNEIGRTALRG